MQLGHIQILWQDQDRPTSRYTNEICEICISQCQRFNENNKLFELHWITLPVGAFSEMKNFSSRLWKRGGISWGPIINTWTGTSACRAGPPTSVARTKNWNTWFSVTTIIMCYFKLIYVQNNIMITLLFKLFKCTIKLKNIISFLLNISFNEYFKLILRNQL